VNGGQTTASLTSALLKDEADLSGVLVQLKLSVIKDRQKVGTIVSNISRYANSQNKVNEAYLLANDAFHVRIEQLSRTVWAPCRAGANRETKWFYERARGQYSDEKGRRRASAAKLRMCEAEYPSNQWFTKTDLAKFGNTWGGLPHMVSRGAQKNFAEFTLQLEKGLVPDKGIPPALLANARGVAIIPRVVKAGFVVAGRGGHGLVIARDQTGAWGDPVFMTLGGASVGFQAGVESTDVVLVFHDRKTLDRLLAGKGKVTLGAEAAVAARPVGRQAAAGTDAQLTDRLDFVLSRERDRANKEAAAKALTRFGCPSPDGRHPGQPHDHVLMSPWWAMMSTVASS
jgi:hypothetical protein